MYVTKYTLQDRRTYYPEIIYCEDCYYKQLRCESCSKDIGKDTCKFIHYSLKRNVVLPSTPYCNDCYEEHIKECGDDLCIYCGRNSYGTSPCSACRKRR